MSSYREKLLHPNWQKKSAEVKELHGWQCQRCGSKDDTLTAHHISYESGKDPWDYPNENFECLCSPCHALLEDALKLIRLKAHQYTTAQIIVLGLAVSKCGKSAVARLSLVRGATMARDIVEMIKSSDLDRETFGDEWARYMSRTVVDEGKQNTTPPK